MGALFCWVHASIIELSALLRHHNICAYNTADKNPQHLQMGASGKLMYLSMKLMVCYVINYAISTLKLFVELFFYCVASGSVENIARLN